MTDRIVIDTSAIVSALIGRKGPGREVVRRCLQGKYKPLVSNSLFQEYEEVTNREKIIRQCPLSGKEIRELLNAFYSVCEWVPIHYLWRPNLKDENDNFLIELAVAGNAKAIVTNNIKDLKGAELSFKELRILTPEKLLGGNWR